MIVEPFLTGNYIKFSTNVAVVLQEHHEIQAFTHWSWERTGRREMVCDLQGVVNLENGIRKYLLTDPAIHTMDGRFSNTGADLSTLGMAEMIKCHQCNIVCKILGLADTEKHREKIKKLKLPVTQRTGTCYFASKSAILKTVPTSQILNIFKN